MRGAAAFLSLIGERRVFQDRLTPYQGEDFCEAAEEFRFAQDTENFETYLEVRIEKIGRVYTPRSTSIQHPCTRECRYRNHFCKRAHLCVHLSRTSKEFFV
jgi:hypothetical protein